MSTTNVLLVRHGNIVTEEELSPIEFAVSFDQQFLFAVALPVIGTESRVEHIAREATRQFKQALHARGASDDLKRLISIATNVGDSNSLLDWENNPARIVDRLPVFLPSLRGPMDPDLGTSPFADRSSRVGLSYIALKRVKEGVERTIREQSLTDTFGSIVRHAVEAFFDVTGIHIGKHGGCIGARAAYELLPKFELRSDFRPDAEGGRHVTLVPVDHDPFGHNPGVDDTYTISVTLRSAGLVVWDAQVVRETAAPMIVTIPDDVGAFGDVEIIVFRRIDDLKRERIWEWRSTLVRSVHFGLGIVGSVKRAIPSRFRDGKRRRETAHRETVETMRQTISHSQGDPWFDWTRESQSVLGIAKNTSLEQQYFPQGERESFHRWLSNLLSGATAITVADPYFDIDGVADLFDAVTESRVALDVITTITARGEEERAKSLVPEAHAQVIINLSGTPDTKVHYLGDKKFHDRYLIVQNDPRSPLRVFSLSNSLNGAMTNYDLFVQELSQTNAERIIHRVGELRRRATKTLSGTDLPDLFARNDRYTKPGRPPAAAVDEAVTRLSGFHETRSPIDPRQLVQDLRTILHADYYGDVNEKRREDVLQACLALNNAGATFVTETMINVLEESRKAFERNGRKLLTNPFRLRADQTLYWLEELHSWSMSSGHMYSMDTGWTSPDLSVFGALLATHPDETTELCDKRGVAQQLVIAGWHAAETEWLHLSDSLSEPEVQALRWPVPRLWHAMRKVEKAIYSEESPNNPAPRVQEIADQLPVEERFLFLGYIDRQLDLLRASSRNNVAPRFTVEQLEAWEETSFERLERVGVTERRAYATARFGDSIDRTPEGITRFLTKFADQDGTLFVRALRSALSTDAKSADRMIKNLEFTEFDTTGDIQKTAGGKQDYSQWLQDANVFALSQLAYLAVQILTPEHLDGAALTKALRSIRVPLQVSLGTSSSDNPMAGQEPHAFFLVHLVAYRVLDERELEVSEEILVTLRSVVQYFSRSDGRLHSTASFLTIDALTVILPEAWVDPFLAVLPKDEYRTILLAAHGIHAKRWMHEVNELLAVSDKDLSWLPIVTGIVYVTYGIRRSSIGGDEPEYTADIAVFIERLLERQQQREHPIGICALEYIRNRGDAQWRRFQEAIRGHQTFGYLLARTERLIANQN